MSNLETWRTQALKWVSISSCIVWVNLCTWSPKSVVLSHTLFWSKGSGPTKTTSRCSLEITTTDPMRHTISLLENSLKRSFSILCSRAIFQLCNYRKSSRVTFALLCPWAKCRACAWSWMWETILKWSRRRSLRKMCTCVSHAMLLKQEASRKSRLLIIFYDVLCDTWIFVWLVVDKPTAGARQTGHERGTPGAEKGHVSVQGKGWETQGGNSWAWWDWKTPWERATRKLTSCDNSVRPMSSC